MMMKFKKIGFLGAGHLAQTLIEAFIKNQSISADRIWASNRSDGKLIKLKNNFNIHIAKTNEELVSQVDIIVLATKPGDLLPALEPISSLITPDQIIISLVAGIPIYQLRKYLRVGRLARAMPNTPSLISRGVVAYCCEKEDKGLKQTIEDLLAPLGTVVEVAEGDEFDTLLVSSSAGTGFVFEIMSYWQDWIEERGIDPHTARKITVETFLGASLLSSTEPDQRFDELVNRVASKKGVTEAGLDSMRKLELERALRLSFEKAWMRNQEIAKSPARG